MLTTVLAEHPWMTTALLVGLVVVGPVIGAWLVPRPRAAALLLVPSIGAVLLLTLVPTSRALAVGCAVEWSIPVLGAVEVMANLVLFVPVVLLAGALTQRPWAMLAAASAGSALIEMVQALTPALGRSCSTNDWLANTLGGLLGALLATMALWPAHRRTRQASPTPRDGQA